MFTEVNRIIMQDLSILLKLHLKYEAILYTLNYIMGFLRIQIFRSQKAILHYHGKVTNCLF